MSWAPVDAGTSIGSCGSEGGRILQDEEHEAGARITLEEGGATAPFSITCGVYGVMFHTRFFPQRDEATLEYELMKVGLAALATSQDAGASVADFVLRYP